MRSRTNTVRPARRRAVRTVPTVRTVLALAAAVAVALGCAGAAGAAGGSDDPGADANVKFLNRLFIVSCAYSHSSNDDPIAHPGEPGVSHRHDFFGNTTTDAYSTAASLRAGGTTCNRPGDTAAYWMPSVLEDGVPLRPDAATFYYRETGTDPGAVVALPDGFSMLAGDPEAMTPQPLSHVEWACKVEGAKKPWRPDIPHCDAGSLLVFRVNFPDCWNGHDLDSPDHRSHVAYSDRSARCPAGYPVRIPQIAMTVRYPGVHTGDLTLAGHGAFAGHADFLNGWQTGALPDLVDGCLHGDRHCSLFLGPGGADRIADDSTHRAPLPVARTGVRGLSTPAGDPQAFAQSAVVSADGATAAYERHTATGSDIVVRSTAGGPATVVSTGVGGAPADGRSYAPSISGDGRFVAFTSDADNLVAGDTNHVRDVFVRDVVAGTTTRVQGPAQPDAASTNPSMSADGHWVAFVSTADNLVPGDANRKPDVFRARVGAPGMTLVSVGDDGRAADQESASPDISADGRYVAFSSWAHGLTADDTNRWSDVFVRDVTAGRTVLASRTDAGRSVNNSSYFPSVSDDGTIVAFDSAATNIVAHDKGETDVFVRNLATGRTARVSGRAGQLPKGVSGGAEVSGDGHVVLFHSANFYLAGNSAAAVDVYACRPDGSGLRIVSAGGDDPSSNPSVSADGRTAVFETSASTFGTGAARGDLEVVATPLSAQP